MVRTAHAHPDGGGSAVGRDVLHHRRGLPDPESELLEPDHRFWTDDQRLHDDYSLALNRLRPKPGTARFVHLPGPGVWRRLKWLNPRNALLVCHLGRESKPRTASYM